MIIYVKVQEMASEEILKYISPTTLNAIKSKDPKPEYRAYIIGHTGDSVGGLVGMGKVVKRWYNHAIEKLFDKVNIGTKLFEGHNKDNTHTNRHTIGEVVGKTIKKVGDKLQTIAITWFKPEHRNKKLDICSIEGDLGLKINTDTNGVDLNVSDVKGISGIVFGDSNKLTPGFGEATLQASIQMFAEENKLLSEDKKMTLNELKQKIQEGGYSASELFNKQQLTNDNEIKKIMELQKNESGYDRRTREQALEKIEAELGISKLAFTKLETENKGLQTKIFKHESKAKIETTATDRKLNQSQKDFLNNEHEGFTPDIENPEKSFSDFVDKTIKKHKTMSEFFNNTTTIDDAGNKPDPKITDTSSGNDDPGDTKIIPVESLEKNPLAV